MARLLVLSGILLAAAGSQAAAARAGCPAGPCPGGDDLACTIGQAGADETAPGQASPLVPGSPAAIPAAPAAPAVRPAASLVPTPAPPRSSGRLILSVAPKTSPPLAR